MSDLWLMVQMSSYFAWQYAVQYWPLSLLAFVVGGLAANALLWGGYVVLDILRAPR